MAPAGYVAPTTSNIAHQGGPATQEDVQMTESKPLTAEATGDRDQDMVDLPAQQATVPDPLHVASLFPTLFPVELSRLEQTRLKMARIQARMEAVMKRPRTESAADSQPSAAKRQQTQKPEDLEVAQERVVQPFPYCETGKIKRCFTFLRVGGPIVGSLQRQNGWGVKFAMDSGTWGVHLFELASMCNILDKSIPLRDVNPAPGELEVVPMAWYAGARVEDNSNEGSYQLEDFEVCCDQDYTGHQAGSILKACF